MVGFAHEGKGGIVRPWWKRARLLCLGPLRRIGCADPQLYRRGAGDAAIDAEILRGRGGLEGTYRVSQGPLQGRAQPLESGVVHDDLRWLPRTAPRRSARVAHPRTAPGLSRRARSQRAASSAPPA